MAEGNTQKQKDLVENNTNINKEVKRMEQEAEKKEVKKEKNLKRVEQGKKLAEWNRKKNNNNKTILEDPAPDVYTQNVIAQNVLTYKYWILGGALAIIGVLYYTNRESGSVPQKVQEPLPKQVQKVPDPPTPPTSDPFAMD